MRPLLAVLLLWAAPAIAQKSKSDPKSKPVEYKVAEDAVRRAGIPLYKLLDQSNHGMKWSADNIYELGLAIQPASDAVKKLQQAHPSAVADAYGNGTLTNAEDTFKLLAGGNLERGCISHQSVAFGAIRDIIRGGKTLAVSKIRYGLPPTQHNAVIVFPKGTNWKYTGIVFDGWLRQKWQPHLMVYLYEDWGPIRPLWGIEIEPRYWKAYVRLIGDDD